MKLFSQNWIKQADNKIKPMYADKSSDLVPIVNTRLPFSFWLSPRSISIRQLHVSPHFHLEPIYLIIFQGSYSLKVMGNLILRGASCLDAFSTYPFRT